MGRLAEGIDLFNACRYFEAHEAFEDLWREADGDLRPPYQGLVQVCAGLVKHARGQPEPASRLIRRGLRKLEAAPAGCLTEFNFPDFAAGMRAILERLESGRSFPPPAMGRPERV